MLCNCQGDQGGSGERVEWGWGEAKLCDAVLVQYMYCICGRRGGGWGSVSLVYENRILLIRVQGYRGLEDKLQTV